MIDIPSEVIVALIALLISSALALLSLVIGKDNKITEFRQVWIDELRSDISSLVADLNSMYNVRQVNWKNDELTLLKHLEPIFSSASSAQSRIKLRLNHNEEESKRVLEIINNFEEYIHKGRIDDFDEFQRLEKSLTCRASDLLKTEWKRVKAGEETYVKTKRFFECSVKILIASLALVVVIALLLMACNCALEI